MSATDKLDDKTEKAMARVAEQAFYGREPAIDALRQRIRELLGEARRVGANDEGSAWEAWLLND